jgi:hypothetical protein
MSLHDYHMKIPKHLTGESKITKEKYKWPCSENIKDIMIIRDHYKFSNIVSF